MKNEVNPKLAALLADLDKARRDLAESNEHYRRENDRLAVSLRHQGLSVPPPPPSRDR